MNDKESVARPMPVFDPTRKSHETFIRRALGTSLTEAVMDIGSAALIEGIDVDAVVAEHEAGVPLAHVLGHAPFLGRLFRCSRAALVPREETELLARVAIEFASARRGRQRILDIGTGCGNLAITLALEVPDATVHASDIEADALELARANVALHGLEERVSLHHGSLFEPFATVPGVGAVDLVVCNPPYIPTSSLGRLPPEVRDYEPRAAFDAGAFGIDVLRGLVKGALDVLTSGGMLAFEIGAGQAPLVERFFRSTAGYDAVERHTDEAGTVRVFTARRGVPGTWTS